MFKRLLLATLIAFGLEPHFANAQSFQPQLVGAQVVTSCGGSSLTSGTTSWPLTQDTTGKLCVSGAGGSGGAVTAASGAYVDCSIVTIGCEADSAWGGSGSGTLVALLKAIYNGVTGPIPTGTANIGSVSINQTTPGSTNAVALSTATVGGGTPYTLASANTTNATTIKASAGQIYEIDAQNNGTAEAYLLMFNTASTPTCTATPIHILQIPAVGSPNSVSGFVIPYANGDAYSTGISFCITTAIGGTGAVAANQVTINASYK